MELRIGCLFPEILNLYSDRGNLLCLQKRLLWRRIGCRMEELSLQKQPCLSGYDLIGIGGGAEEAYPTLAPLMRGGLAAELCAAVEDGVTLLAVASGLQLLGRYIQNVAGEKTRMAAALPLTTKLGKRRMTGNTMFLCRDAQGEFPVIGFENHKGRSYPEKDIPPLGTILRGFGNNGEDQREGLRYKNVFGSYSHGPLLPKNPRLADHILHTALTRKYGVCQWETLPDREEAAAFAAMRGRL